jgi:hypothetical protein
MGQFNSGECEICAKTLDTPGTKVHIMRMNRTFLRIAALSSVLMVVVAGCGRKATGKSGRTPKICPQNGKLSGQRYTNEFFGFTMDVPTNWAIYHRSELEQGIHREYPKPERHYSPMTGWMEIPHIELYNLITTGDNAATLTDGTLTPTNATLSVLSMYQAHFEDEGRPYDGRLPLAMLAGTMDILQQPKSGDSADMEQTGPSEVVLGGRKFYRDTLRLTKRGVPLIRRFYGRIENEHSLIFVLLAPNDADLDRLEQILATTRFSSP